MASSTGTSASFGLLFRIRAPIMMMSLLLSTLCGFLVQGAVTNQATGHGHGHHFNVRSDNEMIHTNSCMVTWDSSPAAPTMAIYERVASLWMLGSSVAVNYQNNDLEEMYDTDEVEFEAYFEAFRKNKINQAMHRFQCDMNDWPELDLQWCLADWHDGKLVPDTQSTLGETCYWNCPCYGWAHTPDTSKSFKWLSMRTFTDCADPVLGLAPHSWLVLLFMVLTIGVNDESYPRLLAQAREG